MDIFAEGNYKNLHKNIWDCSNVKTLFKKKNENHHKYILFYCQCNTHILKTKNFIAAKPYIFYSEKSCYS